MEGSVIQHGRKREPHDGTRGQRSIVGLGVSRRRATSTCCWRAHDERDAHPTARPSRDADVERIADGNDVTHGNARGKRRCTTS